MMSLRDAGPAMWPGGSVRRSFGRAAAGILAVVLLAGAAVAQPPPPPPVPPLPPPPVPPQNQITEPKRVLGKILFWDEQLSSNNTVACGTCHRMTAAGSDTRLGRHPGPDGLFNSPDDKFGSLGVARMNADLEYIEDAVFGFDVQVTRRSAQSVVGAAYANNAAFWDGRAGGTFIDPETGVAVIPGGGALESQTRFPIHDAGEMANEGRTWADVREKLLDSTPLALASRIPPDMAAAVAANPSYAALFNAAFGDPNISARRIAFALATYERTLIANQTPWDAFNAGNPNALTPSQQQGLNTFVGPGRCTVCHPGPVFSNQSFRNIGLRPPADDLGRQEVTGNPADRGRFKTPTLRNVGLKSRFTHTGQFDSLAAVVNFYADHVGVPTDNSDPVLPQINVPPQARPALVDFLQNGLTDPRVAAGQPPFDSPRLRSEMLSGDGNCDGVVNFFDIDALVAALNGPAAYAAAYPGCDRPACDINRDGVIDFFDIDPFVSCLAGMCD